MNTDRRHLDAGQRREIVAALREQGHSLRAIAGAVGVDDKTVRNDLAGADLSAPAEVVGKDGKSYPARRPTVVPAKARPFLPLALQALHSGSATGTHTPW